MGFGRFYTVTEAALGFICNADGAGFKINGQVPTPSQTGEPAESNAFLPSTATPIRDANSAKIDSNKTDNIVLGGTLLKGEPFLDVGYGNSTTINSTKNNHVFNWNDLTPIKGFFSPTGNNTCWLGNNFCDFEPWHDLDDNGKWDSGEPYLRLHGPLQMNSGVPTYDAGGYPILSAPLAFTDWQGEASEPIHDWGRVNTDTEPAWTWHTPDASGKSYEDKRLKYFVPVIPNDQTKMIASRPNQILNMIS
jgi:hypothetical protein